ncbi:MAG: hypothetical protein ACL93V_03155 [Candidatus Electrothrix sp. YB6]
MAKNWLRSIIGTVLFMLAFPASLIAGEYSVVYEFEQPSLRELDNGAYIVELENTRQNDAKIGAPLLPNSTLSTITF